MLKIYFVLWPPALSLTDQFSRPLWISAGAGCCSHRWELPELVVEVVLVLCPLSPLSPQSPQSPQSRYRDAWTPELPRPALDPPEASWSELLPPPPPGPCARYRSGSQLESENNPQSAGDQVLWLGWKIFLFVG